MVGAVVFASGIYLLCSKRSIRRHLYRFCNRVETSL